MQRYNRQEITQILNDMTYGDVDYTNYVPWRFIGPIGRAEIDNTLALMNIWNIQAFRARAALEGYHAQGEDEHNNIPFLEEELNNIQHNLHHLARILYSQVHAMSEVNFLHHDEDVGILPHVIEVPTGNFLVPQPEPEVQPEPEPVVQQEEELEPLRLTGRRRGRAEVIDLTADESDYDSDATEVLYATTPRRTNRRL